MKKYVYGVLFLAGLGTGMVGCKKTEPLNVLKDSEVRNEIMRFDSFDELIQTLETLGKMSEIERMNWEKARDFKSLYTIAYQVYQQFDIENLANIEDLKSFVQENANLVSLNKSDGETEFVPNYVDNSFSKIVSSNRLFIVDELVYKVYDDGLLYCSIAQIDVLKNLDFIRLKGNSIPNGIEQIFYDRTSVNEKICDSNYRTARADNGGERIRLIMECYAGTGLDNNKVITVSNLRPFNRVLGVWYHCQRTISGSLNYVVTWSQNGNTYNNPVNFTVTPTYGWAVEATQIHPGFGIQQALNVRFTFINSSASQTNAGPAIILCQ